MPDSNNFVIAYMDDLIIYSNSVEDHFTHLEDTLVEFKEEGLKLSPKKAQLCKDQLEYMGHIITIRNGRPHISAMQDKYDAICRLETPVDAKGVKRFVGMVNYLSMYLPRLQVLLGPIHKLGNLRKPFVWTRECQENFDEILAMPCSSGTVQWYSDTSRTATGATLCQVIDGKE